MDGTDQRAANNGDRPAPFSLTVAAAADLSVARSEIRAWLGHVLPDRHADEVLLAGGEALANALEHGQAPVTVAMEWTEDATLTLQVRDAGRWQVPASSPTRGRGIPIMSALMDSFTVETKDGTAVQLRRKFGP